MGRCLRIAVLAVMSFVGVSAAPTATGQPAPTPAAGCDTISAAFPEIRGRRLVIAMTGTQPPFSFVDTASGRVTGFDVDLANATLGCLGATAEFRTMQFRAMIPTLESSNADLVWSALLYTAERAQAVNFALYLRSLAAVITAQGNPLNIRSLDDACGRRWATVVGSVEDRAARDQDERCAQAGRPRIEFAGYPDGAAILRAVINGRADVVLTELVLAQRAVQANAPSLHLAFAVETLPYLYGVAARKSDQRLIEGVARAAAHLQAGGVQRALMTQHGLDERMLIPIEVRTR